MLTTHIYLYNCDGHGNNTCEFEITSRNRTCQNDSIRVAFNISNTV